jgi:type III pantothenate kinase
MLTAGGEFSGGLILPGIDLMRFVLHESTGSLPLQAGAYTETPRNTLDAIESGTRHAQAGAVERMVRLMGGKPIVLVSGGGGQALIERLEHLPCRYVENLVLEGLARIGAA